MKLSSRLLRVFVLWLLCLSANSEEKAELSPNDPYEFFQPEDKPKSPSYDKSISDEAALDIVEVTIREIFKERQNTKKALKKRGIETKTTKVYFISVFQGDPSPKFLERFNKNNPSVLVGTGYRREINKQGKEKGFKTVSSGDFYWEEEIGVWVWVSDLRRFDGGVKARAGIYYDRGVGQSAIYVLNMKDGKWIVTGETERSFLGQQILNPQQNKPVEAAVATAKIDS